MLPERAQNNWTPENIQTMRQSVVQSSTHSACKHASALGSSNQGKN